MSVISVIFPQPSRVLWGSCMTPLLFPFSRGCGPTRKQRSEAGGHGVTQPSRDVSDKTGFYGHYSFFGGFHATFLSTLVKNWAPLLMNINLILSLPNPVFFSLFLPSSQ